MVFRAAAVVFADRVTSGGLSARRFVETARHAAGTIHQQGVTDDGTERTRIRLDRPHGERGPDDEGLKPTRRQKAEQSFHKTEQKLNKATQKFLKHEGGFLGAVGGGVLVGLWIGSRDSRAHRRGTCGEAGRRS